MPNKLFNMKINEVSFCRKGMNVGARVALFKMHKALTFSERLELVTVQNEKFEASRDFRILQEVFGDTIVAIAFDEVLDTAEKRSMLQQTFEQFRDSLNHLLDPLSKGETEMNLEALLKLLGDASPEVKKELEALYAKIDQAGSDKKELEKVLAEVVELKKAVEAGKPASTDPDDKIKKAEAAGASKDVLDILKSMKADADKDRAELQKEKTVALRKSFVEKAGTIKAAGEPETVADMLEVIHKGSGDDGVALVYTVIQRLCKSLEESGLFKENGDNGNGNDQLQKSEEIEAQIEKLANDGIQKANPTWTVEQRTAEAWKQNPELYNTYMKAKNKEIREAV